MPSEQISSAPENDVVSESSLASRLINVIVSPSEAFDEVRVSARKNANWVVPLALSMIAGFAFVIIMYSQPQILQQVHDAATQPIQKLVDQGKLTQQAADKQMEVVEKFTSPSVLKAMGIAGVFILTPVMILVLALIVWLLGSKFYKGGFDFIKAMEIVGLASIISLLSTIVRTLMTVIYGNTYMTLGPVLLVGQFDRHSPLHVMLSALNVMDIWWLAILALGLSRVSGAGFVKSAIWIFGLWLFLLVLPTVGLAWLSGGK